jgi:hypothetical protein
MLHPGPPSSRISPRGVFLQVDALLALPHEIFLWNPAFHSRSTELNYTSVQSVQDVCATQLRDLSYLR